MIAKLEWTQSNTQQNIEQKTESIDGRNNPQFVISLKKDTFGITSLRENGIL